jgi:hypothetical protein
MADFQGSALPLTDAGLTKAANLLGVGPAEIWTIIAAETQGCGFWSDRSPQIRYERHIFSRLTHGQYDDGVISAPTSGGYPDAGAPMYQRLGLAIAKDREAALKSASWGIGQVLGENHQAAGYPDVETMVADMQTSEDAQLLAMANFIVANSITDALRNHQWAAYAKVYNGPNYQANQYDTKLANAFAGYAAGKFPTSMSAPRRCT